MIMSEEQVEFLKKYKNNKRKIKIIQFSIFIGFILIWEILGRLEIINTFITSYPSLIFKTIINLLFHESLIHHILVTLSETLVSLFISLIISLIISILIYLNETFDKIIEPYLTALNSLPKVALGPLIIIFIGASQKSVILMAVLISVVVSIESISLGFKNTNKNRIKILKTFNASNLDLLKYVVIPSNYSVIISAAKVSTGLCLIGVVMGEFLTSKAGLGYLILYGSQVFNLTLVMSSIVILLILSIILYLIIKYIEKRLE